MNIPIKFRTKEQAKAWIKEFSKEHPEVKIVEHPLYLKVSWNPEDSSSRTRVRFLKIGEDYAGGKVV